MSLDGVIYIVRLFELMINDITITDSTEITWPKLFTEGSPPSIDGILVLYDVTNEESIIEIPHLLCKFGSTHILEYQSSMSTHFLTQWQTPCRFPRSPLTQAFQMHWTDRVVLSCWFLAKGITPHSYAK